MPNPVGRPRCDKPLEAVADAVQKMKKMSSCVELVQTGQKRQMDMQERLQTARLFLDKVSGGGVVDFILETLTLGDRVNLWKKMTGRLPEAINDLNLAERRAVIRAMSTTGETGERAWTFQQFRLAGIMVGEKLWASRGETLAPSTPGRPKTATDDDKEQIRKDHLNNSSPSNRKLKIESRIRGEDVFAQHMTSTFAETYKGSALKEKISFSTYRRHRPTEFKKASKRTDVCDICCEGNKTRQRLGEFVAKNKKHLTSAHWKASTHPVYLLAHLQEPSIPKSVREALRPMLEELAEVEHHKDEARKQRKEYKKHKDSPPPNTIVVTLDFKEKGRLPMKPEENSELFYKQGAYSLLGFGLHWEENRKVHHYNIDVLLRSTNQDAFAAARCFDEVLARPCFIKNRPIIVWADSGRHFRCVDFISHLLMHPSGRFLSVNFLEGGHGKSDRDGHFGVVNGKLEEVSKKQEIRHLSDVQKALCSIANTEAFQVRLLSETVTKKVLRLPNLTSIAAYERDDRGITQHAFTGSEGFKLQHKEYTRIIRFTPRVSDKLPRPDSDTDVLPLLKSGDESAASSAKEGGILLRLRRKRLRKTLAFDEGIDTYTRPLKKKVSFERRCTSCRETGHYRSSCPQKSSSCPSSSDTESSHESEPESSYDGDNEGTSKSPRKCSVCMKPGHDKRKCPKKRKLPE